VNLSNSALAVGAELFLMVVLLEKDLCEGDVNVLYVNISLCPPLVIDFF
jgi:hypothetical protein